MSSAREPLLLNGDPALRVGVSANSDVGHPQAPPGLGRIRRDYGAGTLSLRQAAGGCSRWVGESPLAIPWPRPAHHFSDDEAQRQSLS
jgi:hypothetical protein